MAGQKSPLSDGPNRWGIRRENEKKFNFLKCPASKSLERNERIKSTIDMMNMVVDNRITKTPEFTGQFMMVPNGFGSEDAGQKTLSRMSREQLAAFLKAESGKPERPFCRSSGRTHTARA